MIAIACIGLFGANPAIRFEALVRTGIDHPLLNAATPEKHQIETMVGGVALLDYDNDGLLDVFTVNGAAQPSLEKSGPEWSNRLYRNLGNWRFADVTSTAGLAGAGYQMGAATGDFDNDGHTDLFVAGVNRNILYRNQKGKFIDITAKAGLIMKQPKPWSIAAAWLDYDKDGDLDLFVVNYVQWDPATEPFCGDPARTFRTYCHPQHYTGLANTLYHNEGDGTFRDVSQSSGIGAHIGKGMGVAIADYDNDGDSDVFVANDTVPNFLFRNSGNGTFQQVSMEAGVGYNDDGRALSSMGADLRDIDDDGWPDLFLTALANETYPLYRNSAKGPFIDITYPARIGALTLPLSGWGTGIYDFDNDGRKDIFTANGDVQNNTEVFSSRKSRQQCAVLRQSGQGKYELVAVGTAAQHRGAAFGDLDHDGRIDAVVSRIGEPPLVLRNTAPGRHWLSVRLRGTASNRQAIGAVIRAGKQWNHVTTSVGYASSSAPEVHFGLGDADTVTDLEIRWPSGRNQRLEAVKADQLLEITEP